MIPLNQEALKRHVESVGAIQGENEALRPLAVEELIEKVPAIVQSMLCSQSHFMPGATRIGEIGAGEAVQSLIDRLRLGKTGGGVVEIDHEENQPCFLRFFFAKVIQIDFL